MRSRRPVGQARHQCSHLHDPDGLALWDLTLGPLSLEEPLWPHTPGAFRTRFKAIGRSMGVPVDPNPHDRVPVISPASLRGGAATEFLFRTGDSERVRRVGKWVSPRVMEIYIQEIQAFSILARLPVRSQHEVLRLARRALETHRLALALSRHGVPAVSWPTVFRHLRSSGAPSYRP